MEAAANAFGEEKGVTVKVFSLGSGTNSDDTLRTEMNYTGTVFRKTDFRAVW